MVNMVGPAKARQLAGVFETWWQLGEPVTTEVVDVDCRTVVKLGVAIFLYGLYFVIYHLDGFRRLE